MPIVANAQKNYLSFIVNGLCYLKTKFEENCC